MIDIAENALKQDDLSCVAYNQDGVCIYSSTEKGIKPIVIALANNPEQLKGSFFADKVIGKAAALLLVQAQVSQCFGKLMSTTAMTVFDLHHIPYRFDTQVEFIENRDRTGMCPMEAMALDITTPQAAYEKYYTFFDEKGLLDK